jgi:tyrosyl-tRNA synthetase
MMSSAFIEEFQSRGYFHQCTDLESLTKLSSNKSIAAYIGFDATAKSLHVGSLMQIMILRLLQKHGHRPIVIVGGGTTKVGDPSGKDETRKILSDDDIKENIQGIKSVLEKFIKFGDGPGDAIIVNNDDWLSGLNYIEFLRDYGRHFSINRMISFDSVKLRLEREQSLSFLEFNYMILQAYDFVELNKRYGCRLQLGGSDQWGNIVNGVELNRRLGREEIFGLTTPLLTTASGAKMGKTAQGAVWLSDDMLSAYDYYQYWRNTEDNDVIKFIKLFTEASQDEIAKLSQLEGAQLNEAKKILAFEATKLCHGEEEAIKARDASLKAFEQGDFGEGLPIFEVDKLELEKGIPAFELLFKAGLTGSGGEAKRLIKGSGAKINGITIALEMEVVDPSKVREDGTILLSSGKKKHIIVKIC